MDPLQKNKVVDVEKEAFSGNLISRGIPHHSLMVSGANGLLVTYNVG